MCKCINSTKFAISITYACDLWDHCHFIRHCRLDLTVFVTKTQDGCLYVIAGELVCFALHRRRNYATSKHRTGLCALRACTFFLFNGNVKWIWMSDSKAISLNKIIFCFRQTHTNCTDGCDAKASLCNPIMVTIFIVFLIRRWDWNCWSWTTWIEHISLHPLLFPSSHREKGICLK